ncbi:uncharacterized protein LOC143186455 [Calliopsis andreniformis]|uniref:uncharacterized protein LOC143186455 n=1 Tax=Calliopsis andreniformis TaxID=337506 RepID=UPI003FCDF0FB
MDEPDDGQGSRFERVNRHRTGATFTEISKAETTLLDSPVEKTCKKPWKGTRGRAAEEGETERIFGEGGEDVSDLRKARKQDQAEEKSAPRSKDTPETPKITAEVSNPPVELLKEI